MSEASHPRATAAPKIKSQAENADAIMPTYARQDLVFERGEGPWLWTADGDKYLDFTSGIAVNALGHAHPTIVKAIAEQAAKLMHTSNLFRVAGQERLAARLCAQTFADKVFFCNSGTEACEGAIKLARRYHFVTGAPQKYRIITIEGAFHGRTLAALAAAGSQKHLDGFDPQMPGFDHVPLGDIDAIETAITDETAAVMLEPIQGEGGIRTISNNDLRRIRKICDDQKILLVLDEVQSGMGRTGYLYAHQAAGIAPDIMASAKGLGGGFPVGAILATNEAAGAMTAGTHGSTFGGNPLAMAAANAVLDVIEGETFLKTVRARGSRLRQSLAELEDHFPDLIKEVRGEGLLVGLKLKVPPADVVAAAREAKLLLVGASDNTVRILPPLNVTEDELLDGIQRLREGLISLSTARGSAPPPSSST